MSVPSIITVAILALLGIGGYYIHSYGKTKKDEGIVECEEEQITIQVIKEIETIKTIEKVKDEVSKIPDSSIDDELRSLGIMRDSEDY